MNNTTARIYNDALSRCYRPYIGTHVFDKVLTFTGDADGRSMRAGTRGIWLQVAIGELLFPAFARRVYYQVGFEMF